MTGRVSANAKFIRWVGDFTPVQPVCSSVPKSFAVNHGRGAPAVLGPLRGEPNNNEFDGFPVRRHRRQGRLQLRRNASFFLRW